jgi:hypothetical protein
MLNTFAMILFSVAAMAPAAVAQEGQAPPGVPPQASRAGAQVANIRIELTIVDQRSDAQSAPRTVTLLIEDRQSGRIRTGRNNAMLNIDARPEMLREGRIRVMVSLEYTPQDGPDRATQPPIQESLTALLEDGKPLVISQSADPTSDRKVRLEVKATVVR